MIVVGPLRLIAETLEVEELPRLKLEVLDKELWVEAPAAEDEGLLVGLEGDKSLGINDEVRVIRTKAAGISRASERDLRESRGMEVEGELELG